MLGVLAIMSDEFDFELDLSSLDDVDSSNDIGDISALLDSVGVDNLDEIAPDEQELIFDIGSEGNDLTIDLDESGESDLFESILLRSTVDISETLVTYAQCTRALLGVLGGKAKNAEEDIIKYAISSSEFPYMDAATFKVFHGILVDLSTGEEYVDKSPEECAEKSLELLATNIQWYPGLNKDEYIKSFVNRCAQFRKLASATSDKDGNDLSSMISMEELQLADTVFSINSSAFSLLSTFLSDTARFEENTEMSPSAKGTLCSSYRESANSRVHKTFTVATCYDVIMSYLSSDDLLNTLHMTRSELLDYSRGELIRRLLCFELTTGICYPRVLVNSMSAKRVEGEDYKLKIIIPCLQDCAQDSVACEILELIAMMMLVIDHGRQGDMAINLLHMIYDYFMVYLEDESLVNPVIYGCVGEEASGNFNIKYAVDEVSYDVVLPTVLCSVVGNKTNAYCLPDVYVDRENHVVVCPPNQLVTMMNTIKLGDRFKVNGNVVFNYNPTIQWLAENNILTDTTEHLEISKVSTPILESEESSLLHVLMDYDNKFDKTLGFSGPIITYIPSSDITVVSVSGLDASGTEIVCAVAQGDDTDLTNMLGVNGVVVRDIGSSDIYIQYYNMQGDIVEVSTKAEECQMRELVPEEVSKSSVDWTFFVPKANVPIVASQEYCKAVSWLCGLAGLDYQEELFSVQQIISKDFYYLFGISKIDELVSSRLLSVYTEYMKAREEAGITPAIDNFNLSSLKELVGIILGEDNPISKFKEPSQELTEEYHKLESKLKVTVSSICSELDSFDFNVLALHVLSKSILQGDYHLEEYYSMRSIPSIGSRLCVLEHKLLVMRVFDILGKQSVTIFNKQRYLSDLYYSEVSKDTVDAMNEWLLDKAKRTAEEKSVYSLPLTKYVLNMDVNEDYVVLKYLVLERDLYGMLSTLHAYGAEYSKECQAYLVQLGFDEGTNITTISRSEFQKKVKHSDVVEFCSKNKERLYDMVVRGLVSEVSVSGSFNIVKAFDMFNSFNDLFTGINMSEYVPVDESVYTKSLCEYCGSMLLSYCPVVGDSANNIDGGMDRISAFVSAPEDFLYDEDLLLLRQYSLRDMRVIINSGE